MYGINSKKHYANLNLIRGLAAITVMLYHVRYQFFVTYTSKLAGFAYTLYLVHFPVVEFLGNSVFKVRKSWNFDFLHMLYGILIMTLILVYSITIWYFTEAKTKRVRLKITELLS